MVRPRSPSDLATRKARPPLYGRDAELRVLGEALNAASGGRGSAVVIEGEPGTGKTRTLQEMAARASALSFDVVSCMADEVERARPFGPFVGALGLGPEADDPDRASLGRLLTGTLAASEPSFINAAPEVQFRILDGIVSLVDRLAAKRPLLLTIDDAHWADPSTCLVIAALARRLATLPAVLAIALRRTPRSPELDAVLRSLDAGGATDLALDRLDDTSVAAIVTAMVGSAPGPGLLAAAAKAGGNPFFLIELIDALTDAGRLVSTPAAVDLSDDRLPDTLRSTVLARIVHLHPTTAELVRLAAVLGSGFTLNELSVLGEFGSVAAVAALDEALAAGILEQDGSRLAFRHELLREVCYEEIPEAARVVLHRSAARVLIEEGAEPLRVARHLSLGAHRGDAEAVAWIARAASEAAPRSPEVALALINRACELVADDDLRRDLEISKVEILTWSGRSAESEALARELLPAISGRVERSRVRRLLSTSLFVQSRLDEAVQEIETAAAELPPGADRSRVLAEAALGRLARGDLDAATEHAEHAIASDPDPRASALALSVLSRLDAFALDVDASLRRAEAAVSVAELDTSGEAARYTPHLFLGFALHDLDRLDDVAATVRDGSAVAMERGSTWALPLYQGLAAFNALRRGSLGDAIAEARAGLSVAEETGSRLADVWCHSVLGLAALHMGDVGTARGAAAAATDCFATTNAMLGIDLMVVLQAAAAELDGASSEALRILRDGWNLFDALGLGLNRQVLALPLVRAALASGDERLAEDAASYLEGSADAIALPAFRGAASLARGLVSHDAGPLLEAVESYRTSPRRIELAQGCEAAATELAAQRATADALPLLEEGLAIAESCGAVVVADRIDEKLQHLGSGRAASARRSSSGWESLTPSEEAVVRLVGEGLSNAEIAERLWVSRRTVESHLYHVYPKLGIASRSQLAAQSAQRYQ